MCQKVQVNNKQRHWLTVQVVVLLAVGVREREELSEQQRVLQDPLDGFDQVRLQSGRVLLSGVSLSQESFEIWIRLCWRSRNMSIRHFVKGGKETQTDTGSCI